MAKKRINMINLCNLAWDRRTKKTHEEYEDIIKNLLSHAYATLTEEYSNYCKSKNYNDDGAIFKLFQMIFIFIILSDGDFLQGEYDAYVKFCHMAGFKELSVSECKYVYEKHSTDDLANSIRAILDLRPLLDSGDYEALVQGFCYLALAGDKSMDENEYYILKCFFEEGFDEAPDSWQEFKRQW